MPTVVSNISITASASDLSAARRALSEKQFKQAIYQAVTRTARTMTVQLRKATQEKLAINAKYVRRAIDWHSEPDGQGGTAGIIDVQRQGVPLVAYKVKGSRAGIFALMDRDRGPLELRHAFFANVTGPLPGGIVSGGHKGVFTREKGVSNTGRLTERGYAPRLPIREVLGVPVIAAVEDQVTRDQFVRDTRIALRKNLLSQIDRFTK